MLLKELLNKSYPKKIFNEDEIKQIKTILAPLLKREMNSITASCLEDHVFKGVQEYNADKGLIKKFFKEMEKGGEIGHNPAYHYKQKKYKPRESVFTTKDVRKILDFFFQRHQQRLFLRRQQKSKYDFEMYRLFLYLIVTGLRKSEILTLRPCDILFDEEVLVIEKSKNNSNRRLVPFYCFIKSFKQEVLDDMRKICQEYESRGAMNEPIFSFPCQQSVNNRWKAALAKLKGEIRSDFHIHDSRRYYVQMAHNQGMTFADVKYSLDHKDSRTTSVYYSRIPPSGRESFAEERRMNYAKREVTAL